MQDLPSVYSAYQGSGQDVDVDAEGAGAEENSVKTVEEEGGTGKASQGKRSLKSLLKDK